MMFKNVLALAVAAIVAHAVQDQLMRAKQSKHATAELVADGVVVDTDSTLSHGRSEAGESHNTLTRKDITPEGHAFSSQAEENDAGLEDESFGGDADMSFGGTRHADFTNLRFWHSRPELVKSVQCKGGDCEGCDCQGTGCRECWYGAGDPSALKKGVQKIEVPARAHFDKFILEMWAECPSNQDSTWDLEYEKKSVVNGRVQLYVDGAKVNGNCNKGKNGKCKWQVKLEEKAKKHVRVVFSPKKRWRSSSAVVRMYVKNPAAWVDDCMSHKNCLSDLDGDGSEAGKRIRGSNTLQLKCLKDTLAKTGETNAVKDKCISWRECLDTQQVEKGEHSFLQNILEAAVGENKEQSKKTVSTKKKVTKKKKILAELDSAMKVQASVSENSSAASGDITGACLHPAIDDPEAWDCDCPIPEVCDGRSDTSICIREYLCGWTKVCDSWKEEVNCPDLLLSSQPNESTQTEALDETLQGKRSC